jgi:hypothetical protein
MVYKVHHARSGGVLHGARPGWLTYAQLMSNQQKLVVYFVST